MVDDNGNENLGRTKVEVSYVNQEQDYELLLRLPPNVREFVLYDAGTPFNVQDIFDGYKILSDAMRERSIYSFFGGGNPERVSDREIWSAVLSHLKKVSREDHMFVYDGTYPGDIRHYRHSLSTAVPKRRRIS